jgi:DNA mismatch repair ATPase MutL
MGAPGVSRATREDQHLFVNRRPVENRGLNFALLEGYHTALMKGRYPVCCLFIEVNPAEVDVNIHPAKREVKFHREKTVRQWSPKPCGKRCSDSTPRPKSRLSLHRHASAPPRRSASCAARPVSVRLPDLPKLYPSAAAPPPRPGQHR